MQRYITVVLLLFLIFYSFESSAADYKTINLHPDYNHDKYGTEPKDIVKEFRAYMSSFDSDDDDDGDGRVDLWGIPEFVAYEIKKFEGTLGKGPKRPSPWITDKELEDQGIAPNDSTYRYSRAFRSSHPNWYIRGHLCMKQHAWRLGEEADWNTHTMLNAVPQRDEFNRKIWLDMENKTAAWADKYDSVWIIAGPVINNLTPRNWLGEPLKNEMEIAIPDALFKIVVKESDDPGRPSVLAFIYPQEDNGYENSPYDHTKYLVSVDDVEDVTGLDFLTNLLGKDEREIEEITATELWGL